MFKKLLTTICMLGVATLSYAGYPYWQIRIDPLTKDATAYMCSWMQISTGITGTSQFWIDSATGKANFGNLFVNGVRVTTANEMFASSTAISNILAQLQIDTTTLAGVNDNQDIRLNQLQIDTTTLKSQIADIAISTAGQQQIISQLRIDTATLSEIDSTNATNVRVSTETIIINIRISTETIDAKLNQLTIDTTTIRSDLVAVMVGTETLAGVDDGLQLQIDSLQDNTTNYVTLPYKDDVRVATETLSGRINQIQIDTTTIQGEIDEIALSTSSQQAVISQLRIDTATLVGANNAQDARLDQLQIDTTTLASNGGNPIQDNVGVIASTHAPTLVTYTVYRSSMAEVERVAATKLSASSGSIVVPYTVFYASTTEIERIAQSKLSASSGSIVVPYTIFNGSMTEVQRLFNVGLSSGVRKITAGTNITLSPNGETDNVTINASFTGTNEFDSISAKSIISTDSLRLGNVTQNTIDTDTVKVAISGRAAASVGREWQNIPDREWVSYEALAQRGVLKSNAANIGEDWTTRISTLYSNGSCYAGNGVVFNVGYITSDIGNLRISRSLDYGRTWANTTVAAATKKSHSIEYLGGTYVMCNSDNNRLYRSSDMGTSWQEYFTTGVGSTFYTTRYLERGIVLILDYTGEIYRSTNYGLNFTDIGGSETNITGCVYAGNGRVYFCSQTKVWQSNDYGATWVGTVLPDATQLYSIEYLGNGTIIVGGEDSTGARVWRNNDFMSSSKWLSAGLPAAYGAPVKMKYAGNSMVFGVTRTGYQLIKSTDSGCTWASKASLSNTGGYMYASNIMVTENGGVLVQHGQNLYLSDAVKGMNNVNEGMFFSSMTAIETRMSGLISAAGKLDDQVGVVVATHSPVLVGMINSTYTVIMSSFNTVDKNMAGKLSASSGTTICTLLDTKLAASSGSIVTPNTIFYSSMTEIERRFGLTSSGGLADQLNVIKSTHVTIETGGAGQYLMFNSTNGCAFTWGKPAGGTAAAGIKWSDMLYPDGANVGTNLTVPIQQNEYINTVWGSSRPYWVAVWAAGDTTSVLPYTITIPNTYAGGNIKAYVKYMTAVAATGTYMPVMKFNNVAEAGSAEGAIVTSTATFTAHNINTAAYGVYTTTFMFTGADPAYIPFTAGQECHIGVFASGSYSQSIQLKSIEFMEQ